MFTAGTAVSLAVMQYNRGVDASIPRIVFGSSNAGKLAEFRDIFAEKGLAIELIPISEFPGTGEIPEIGATFREIAAEKARYVASRLHEIADSAHAEEPSIGMSAEPPVGAGAKSRICASAFLDMLVLAEDSGLCVSALGGWPGIGSRRVASTDEERLRILLDKMRGAPEGKRGAEFVCAAAIAGAREVLLEAEGCVRGTIAFAPRGSGGFGYDPVFYYPPAGKTFGEMSRAEKSLVSHRRRAAEKIADWILENAGAPLASK